LDDGRTGRYGRRAGLSLGRGERHEAEGSR